MAMLNNQMVNLFKWMIWGSKLHPTSQVISKGAPWEAVEAHPRRATGQQTTRRCHCASKRPRKGACGRAIFGAFQILTSFIGFGYKLPLVI